MKKLLLFIILLFGILSMQSFAWNYGCGIRLLCAEPTEAETAVITMNLLIIQKFRQSANITDVPEQWKIWLNWFKNNWYSISPKCNVGFLFWKNQYSMLHYLIRLEHLAVVSSENGQIFYGGADPRFGVSKDRAESYAKNSVKRLRVINANWS